MPTIFASIDFNIETLPDHGVSIFIRNAGKLSTLDSIHTQSGSGVVSISSDKTSSSIDLLVKLKKDGKDIIKENFYEIPTDNPININLIPGEVDIVDSFKEVVEENNETETENLEVEINEEELNEEPDIEDREVVENTEELASGLTGKVVQSSKKVLSSKTTYYIIGGIVIILVLGFLIHMSRNKTPGSFKVVKFGENNYDRRLEDAERKLEVAKSELDEIKNRKSKLREAEEKFKRDKEELERLKREEE